MLWYTFACSALSFLALTSAAPDASILPPPPDVPQEYFDEEPAELLDLPSECTVPCNTFSQPNFVCATNGQRYWNECYFNLAKCSDNNITVTECSEKFMQELRSSTLLPIHV